MEAIFVQFADETDQRIVASFAGPQDEEIYPHQGSISTDDPRYVSFLKEITTL